MKKRQQRNARFYIRWKETWTKITLTPARPVVELVEFTQHEEGWAKCYESYRLVAGGVECECLVDSVDCDGRHEWDFEGFCPFHRLRLPPQGMCDSPPDHPSWTPTTYDQSDEYAEMAGY